MANSRLQYLQTRYQEKGFSEKTVNLFLSAVDPNSNRTMSSSLRAWVSWCEGHFTDPITCPISDICDFFVDMLAKGLAFNTIAGYRTAISEVHEFIDGSPIGSHPDVSRALRAIHMENPPTIPSDDPVDISPSLDYIRDL